MTEEARLHMYTTAVNITSHIHAKNDIYYAIIQLTAKFPVLVTSIIKHCNPAIQTLLHHNRKEWHNIKLIQRFDK